MSPICYKLRSKCRILILIPTKSGLFFDLRQFLTDKIRNIGSENGNEFSYIEKTCNWKNPIALALNQDNIKQI